LIETPKLTVDGIIKLYDNDSEYLGIVFIERKYPPLGYALPGGFVDVGERVEDALVREMSEETSLDVEIEYLLGVYSDPSRDSRMHTVSITYVCKATGTPKAQDDAKSLFVKKPDEVELDTLCFDHSKMVKDYLKKENFEKN
jgi:8-oxo-dGTP diphosphatase